jgi:hypothetical protein
LTDDSDQRRFLLGGAFFGFVFLMLCTAHARAPIYYWVDKYGNMHATDRIDEVPNIYQDAYKKAAQRPNNTRIETTVIYVSDRPLRESKSNSVDASIVKNQTQKTIVPSSDLKTLRLDLRQASDALAQLNKEIGSLRFNPILRETPAIKTKIIAAEKKQLDLITQVELFKKRIGDIEKKAPSREQNE